MELSSFLLAIFLGAVIYHYLSIYVLKKPTGDSESLNGHHSADSKSETGSTQDRQAAQAKILKSLTFNKDYKPTHKYAEVQNRATEELAKNENASVSEGWEKCDSVDGVEVHRRYIDGGPIPMMHSRVLMKAPPHAIFKVVTDLKKKADWDKMFKLGYAVEELDEFSKIVYFEYKPVFPTSARDFVVLTNIKPGEDGSLFVGGVSVEHEKCPEKSSNVRAKAICSGWIIRPQAGEDGKTYSLVTNISLVNLSGNLPTKVLQKVAGNAPLVVKSVREIVEKMSPEEYDLTKVSTSNEGSSNGDSKFGEKEVKIDRRKLDDIAVRKLLLQGEAGLRRVVEETAAKDWLPLGEEKGVRLYQKQGKDSSGKTSEFYCFMGKGVIKASPKLIFKVLTKPQFRKEYDSMLKELRVVRKLAANGAIVWAHMETRQCLVKQGRDFCVLQYYRGPDTPVPELLTDVDDFKGKYIISSQSVIDPACPEQSDVIRGDVITSGWIVEQTAKGESAVSVLLQIDFRGAVPPRLINIVGRKQPLCLANLRSYIEDYILPNLEK